MERGFKNMSWRQKALRTNAARLVAVGVTSMMIVAVLGVVVFRGGRAYGSGTGGVGQCQQIMFIAVMGSGEYPSGDDFSVSPELETIFENMANVTVTSGASLGGVALPYPATSVDVLLSGYADMGSWYNAPEAWVGGVYNSLSNAMPQYLLSEQTGESEMRSLFANERAQCSTSKFVLGGYSQGAMVIHDFLNYLAGTKDSASQASIVGIALVADPARTANSGTLNFGTAPDSSAGVCGISRIASKCAKPPVKNIASMFQSRTVSVCNVDDIVCDSSGFALDLAKGMITGTTTLGDYFNYGVSVHTAYSKNPQPLVLAGELMGRYANASL